jgi:hypothetical protein
MYKILLGTLRDPDQKRCAVTWEHNSRRVWRGTYLELRQLIKLQAAEVSVVSLYWYLVPC